MGEVEKNALLFWQQKIVNDPEMLAEDPRGNKVGSKEFEIKKGEALKTFCNIGVQRICRGMDYDKLDGMIANSMYEYMSKNWIVPTGSKVDKMQAAYIAAQLGDICVLALKGNPHGHVAIAASVKPMLFSGKWCLYSPQVANIGKNNGFIGANYAFAEVPEVFILGRTVS